MSFTICSRCRPAAAARHLDRVLRASSQRRSQSQTAQQPEKDVVIFSGIQPTGVPHIGNYLGAMRQWKRLQDGASGNTKLYFSVVDLHAITMPQDAPVLRQRRTEMLAALIAIGLDPKKSILFYQSSVPAHSELMWILSCTASMGYLGRMTQWKAKVTENRQFEPLDDGFIMSNLKLGLFSYPVLQAADILIHRATHVPVGADQMQHLEFARECATNFNHTFGGTLVSPQTITTPSPRVMSLMNPLNKMSKSTPNHRSRILITASADEIRTRIRGAVTDSEPKITYEPKHRPGVANLLELFSQCDPQGREPDDIAHDLYVANASMLDLKKLTADAVVKELEGLGDRYQQVLSWKGGKWLDEVEEEGAERARANAAETMRMVKDVIGLSRF